jgi:hypothetical protein
VTGLPNIDPTQVDARANDTAAKKILADEANELLSEKGIFMLAVRALRIRWYGELLDATERDKKNDLLAKLKVLDAVPLEVKRFVSDYSMARNRQGNAGRN